MNQGQYFKNIHSKFIEIWGEDRSAFLQGLITNDINKCKDQKSAIYSCFLSAQGKFLADFFVIIKEDNILIEIHQKYFESFYNKLNMYKLRSKVELNEKINLSSYVIFSKKNLLLNNSIASFDDTRSINIGRKTYVKSDSEDIKNIHTLNELNIDQYKKILIKNLIPYTPDDLIENKSLLLENNFQNINAIDWEKGCYIGQEITARMKYRALLKKKLYNLELISGNIKIGDTISNKEIIIGEVISKSNKYLLCMLKISLVEDLKIQKEIIKIDSQTMLKFL